MSCNEIKNKTPEEKSEIKKDLVSAACTAADAVLTSIAGTKAFQKAVCAVAKRTPDVAKAKKLNGAVGAGICSSVLLSGDFIPTLAQALDRLWAKKPVEEAVEEPPVEEIVAEPVAEVVPAMAISDDDDDDDDFAGISMAGLNFIDVKAQPEEYAALLEQEKRGEIRIVTRYRRSFLSRLIQSQGEVQEFYTALKNKFLSYKGVKGRISWGQESFNRGRIPVAKVVAKSKTLYLYLALDPATVEAIEDGKYNIINVGDKKKYETVPVLMKVSGPRKLKHALELIDLVCRDTLQLPDTKNFEEQDYSLPYQSTEELVESGEIKMLVAGIDMSGVSEPTSV